MNVFKKVSWINQIHLGKVSNGLLSKVQSKNDGKIKPKGNHIPSNAERFYLNVNSKENKRDNGFDFCI